MIPCHAWVLNRHHRLGERRQRGVPHYSTEETSENGNYFDRRTAGGKVEHVASGEYTEKTDTSHEQQAESSSEWADSTGSTALLKDKTSLKYEIKGKYGQDGSSVEVMANDLKEKERYEAHFVDSHYSPSQDKDYKTFTDIVFNETLSIPLKGDASQSATYSEKIDEKDPDLDDDSTSYSDNQAEDLSAPSQVTSYDTGPSGGGVLSYAVSAAGTVLLDTLDPSDAIRGAAGALGTLALATVVYESPWWEGFKAGTYNLFDEQL